MPDPQKEVKELIERLYAQYKRVQGQPGIPLVFPPGTSAIKADAAGVITGVDLAATPTTDADLEKIVSLTAIEDLRLSGTKITNAGVGHLKKLPKLKFVTLYWTEVSDEAIDELKELKSLTYLGINSTKVTEAGMKALREALPGCQVQ